jgi:hypothetical protein
MLNENLWEVLIKHVTLSNDINVYRICADAIVAFSYGHLFRLYEFDFLGFLTLCIDFNRNEEKGGTEQVPVRKCHNGVCTYSINIDIIRECNMFYQYFP